MIIFCASEYCLKYPEKRSPGTQLRFRRETVHRRMKSRRERRAIVRTRVPENFIKNKFSKINCQSEFIGKIT